MIINLISSPRNVSTAIMYAFAHRDDFKVIDEPFYAYYLAKSGAQHPGRQEILQSQSTRLSPVIDLIKKDHDQHENVFIKNMAHHLIDTSWDFLLDYKNVFLVRNPKQLIASFTQVIAQPQQSDIGIKMQGEIFDFLLGHNHEPLVVDSGTLLQDPKTVLKRLCEQLELPMQSGMLSWEKGPIKEDGVWASYWYKNVHNSTGFEKQKTSERSFPEHCQALLEESLPYYHKLLSNAIN